MIAINDTEVFSDSEIEKRFDDSFSDVLSSIHDPFMKSIIKRAYFIGVHDATDVIVENVKKHILKNKGPMH